MGRLKNVPWVISLICVGCGSDLPLEPVSEPAAKLTASQGHREAPRFQEDWFGIPAWASAIEKGDLFQVRFWVESGIMSVHQRLQWFGRSIGLYGPPEYRGGGKTALHLAVQHRRPAIARYLLDQGVDVNGLDDSERTALMYAANTGPLSLVKLLVQREADVSLSDYIDGRTALTSACWGRPGQLLIVKYLVEQGGASVNQVSYSRRISMHPQTIRTPLMAAVTNIGKESLDTMAYLIEKGARVNWQNPDSGWTALMSAAIGGLADRVRLLVSSGANPDLRDVDGETAADKARRRGHTAITDYLDGLAASD